MSARAERRRYGASRAGASGRAFARERLSAFVRSRWKVLLLMAGLLLVAYLPVVWFALAPISDVRGFALGAYTAAVIAYVCHFAVVASGAGLATMGELAETWTHQELARLPKPWRVVNHVIFRQGDVDHIAIGPDGVIVVETKWTSDRVVLDGTDPWMSGALRQAQRNARDVAKVLGWGARKDDSPVSPLVVVWGPRVEPATDERHHDSGRGVNLIAGKHLRRTLDGLGDQTRLDDAERQRCYETIRGHVDRRDAHDERTNGPARAPWYEQMQRVAGWLLVASVGFFVCAFGLRLPWPAVLGIQCVALIAGAAATKFTPERALGIAWLIGSQAVSLLLLLAYAAEVLS
jgi:hypothetical protein